MFDTRLTALAESAARKLVERHETIAVAESSCGGLISASLLSIPGASAYYVGGTVTYTRLANQTLLAGVLAVPPGLQGETEEFALHLAHARGGQARDHMGDRRERRGRAVGQPLWRSGGSRVGRRYR